jgi:hypothetical protein
VLLDYVSIGHDPVIRRVGYHIEDDCRFDLLDPYRIARVPL